MNIGIKKLIYLVEVPFNQRDYQRFGIEIVLQNGFAVEVWDFGKFLHRDIYETINANLPDPLAWNGCRSFLTQSDALNAICGLDQQCFVVCLLNYNLDTYPFFRIVSEKRIKYSVLLANGQPRPDEAKVCREFFGRLKKITPQRLPSILFNRTPYSWLGIKSADLLLAGGRETVWAQRYPIGKNTKILWAHAPDYDLYLAIKDKEVQVDNNMAVFLDEYGPFHSDFLLEDTPQNYSPEDYYLLLCRFFDLLEKKYDLRITIAAHPRSNYEKHPDYFGKRSVIRGRTEELVQRARFVIAHHSTSLNFAVLFEKPVIFITTDVIEPDRGKYINSMAFLLGKTPINLNRTIDLDLDKELEVNKDAYANYRNSYIKIDGTGDLPLWQIFSNYIKAQ